MRTRLYRLFPIPAVRNVSIRYSLAAEGRVTLRVHDLTGRVVRTLADGEMRPGRYSLSWSGTDDRGRELARGVYFCRFAAGDTRTTQKLVLARQVDGQNVRAGAVLPPLRRTAALTRLSPGLLSARG